MEEKLAWMDEKYLSHFNAKEVKSEIPYQKPFAETLDIVHEYPVLDGDPLENNAYLSYNMVIGSGLDVKLNVAFLFWSMHSLTHREPRSNRHSLTHTSEKMFTAPTRTASCSHSSPS